MLAGKHLPGMATVTAPNNRLQLIASSVRSYGKERTTDEFRQLCSEAGLRLARSVDTASPLKVVEARPV